MVDVESSVNSTTSSLLPSETNIVYPPPDIRKIVDRTASFVARNDRAFEDKVRESKRGNPQFSFLNPGDPYNAYYRMEIARNLTGEAPAPIPEQFKSSQALPEPIAMALQTPAPPVNQVPVTPPPFQFKLDAPPISAQDFDIIKLTALFAARNGPQFRVGLAQREGRNYQFDFTKPGHSLFPVFNRLVEQYSAVLLPPKTTLARLAQARSNKHQNLERVMSRVEYSLYEESQRKKAKEKEDKERMAYASIDWHDFVIVQTLEFTETDQGLELPPPLRLEDFATMSLMERRAAAMNQAPPPESVSKPEPSVVKKESNSMEDSLPQPESSPQFQVPAPPSIPPSAASNAPMKIRKDYIPKAMAPKSGSDATQACPICGDLFPMSEIDEHIRVESLDPKWKEQKAVLEARQRDSNLLRSSADVAKHLKHFSSYRSDLFGSDEVGIGRKIEEDAERRKQAEREKVVYDGFTTLVSNIPGALSAAGGLSRTPLIEDQIAAIHRKHENMTSNPGHSSIPQPPHNHQQPGGPPMHPPSFAPPPFTGAPYAGFPPPPPREMYAPPPMPFYPGMGRYAPMDQESKRFKPDDPLSMLIPEKQWINMHPAPYSVQVAVPNDSQHPEWNLKGQTLWLENLPAATTLQQVKDKIAELLQFPASKQKLTVHPAHPHIGPQIGKNALSLAVYNIPPNSTLELAIKERGGKK